MPADLRAGLVVAADWSARAASGPRPPAIPGYEDLVEVGRGGCGVVYRARETVTGREVAVKVIRTGVLATPAEYARFRAEATAAAKLRHPNVVTVYAVGGPDPVPFYAMEYLPGGSLAARLDGTPCDPKAAAGLVAAAAGGVHHAHEQGVVHRDLKPGNILLDRGPPGVPFGTPKVADFGTARVAGASPAPTPTQVVVGTPSYMAPEQAFGRRDQVGPAADVYALGAVLYELLTGRPPFKGGTPYETLLQVRSQDPVPPRRLRPDLPRDVETVCLKALEKDPARRYASAAALADDLGRFLTGRPVSARPVGPAGHLGRWARRNPAVAALATLSVVLLVAGLTSVTVLWRRAEAQRAVAEARRERAREAVMLYAVAAKRVHATTDLSEPEWQALDRAVELSLDVLEESTGDPGEDRRAAFALLQLADVLFKAGRRERGEELTRRATAVLGRLAAAHPAVPGMRYDYAQGCAQHATMLKELGRAAEARARYWEAVRVAEGLVAEYPDRDGYRTVLANFRVTLGVELLAEGDPAALGMLEWAAATHRELLDRYPQDPDRYVWLKWATHRLGEAILTRGGSPEQFAGLFRELADRGCRALAEFPDHPGRGRALLDSLDLDVHALDHLGRRADADAVVAQLVTAWQGQVARRADDPDAAAELAGWLYLDGLRRWPGDVGGATERFTRAVAEARRATALSGGRRAERLAWFLATCPDPAVRRPAEAVAVARGLVGTRGRAVLGVALFEDGQYAAARVELEAAGPACSADCRLYLALALHKTGAPAAARSLLAEVATPVHNDPYTGPGTRTLLARARAEILPAGGG